MKATFLFSIAALMALAAAQSPEALVNPAVVSNDATSASPVLDSSTIVDDSIAIEAPAFSASDDSDVSASSSSSSKFTAWTEANYHGSKQTNKGTSGCYRLDGRAVASYEGSKKMQYGFYKGRNCDGNAIYTSLDRSIMRISPRIYPRSVRILNQGTDSSKRTLTVWSNDKYHGDRQKVYGTGCKTLNGLSIRSFKGEGKYRYKFFDDRECFDKTLLESGGGDKSSTSRIRPRSVYVYTN
ncbi:hypothetical protein BGZ70_000851 [Mortierella alpina]|uniref:Uncharacterized protein n=1 Tax=Mortierella alpina TaxID=64518 RepID=A0A9P6LYN7_MORAP|nr:hypothetical protein BGZ70_000851 [Mortierella alpina]